MLQPFILVAERAGLPVKILRYLEQYYSIHTTKQAGYTDVRLNNLYLNRRNYDLLKGARLGPTDRAGVQMIESEGEAVNELYHEATHAYLDLKLGRGADDHISQNYYEKDHELQYPKKIFEKYRHYYAGASLREPIQCRMRNVPQGMVSDPETVLNEAMAMYIGTRASQYWTTMDRLTFFRDTAKSSNRDKLLRFVASEIMEYERTMANRVVGYDEFCGKQSAISDKIIPEEVKVMCDRILENKIPDKFLDSQKLRQLHSEVVM